MGTMTVRYNTIEGYDGYGRDPDRPGNATIYGNLFLTQYIGCAGGGTVTASYSGNVFRHRAAGQLRYRREVLRAATRERQAYTNVDRQADYHLAANDTCAKGAGSASGLPAQDIDEEARPQGGAPDAGADESSAGADLAAKQRIPVNKKTAARPTKGRAACRLRRRTILIWSRASSRPRSALASR